MPESKNNFIKSKMNKDLDERLIPQGEYRDAQNVTISRSEGDDVGTFQNILGNSELSNFGLTDVGLEVIGHIADEVNKYIYVFLTNYNDSSNDQLSNVAPLASGHYIIRYHVPTNSSITLVNGSFLNFSKTHRIYGVNLLENLLFWTDNRNQPRKINVTSAAGNPLYYSTEDTISVAKFYPSNIPNFYKEVEAVADQVAVGPPPNVISLDNVVSCESLGIEPGMQVVNMTDPATMDGIGWWVVSIDLPAAGDVQLNQSPVGAFTQGDVLSFSKYGLKNCSEEYLPAQYFTTLTGGPVTYDYIDTYQHTLVPAIADGDRIQALGEDATKTENDNVITNLNKAASTLEISPASTLLAGSEVIISKPNPNYDSEFTGDTEFLKDKYIRFAYRLKFDDNEYSIISPFTQIAFIPNQYGSFLPYDEERAAKSSVLNFFENYINCIDLYFQTPLPTNNTSDYTRLYQEWSDFINDFKVVEVDILCKFADKTAIQVIDTISADRILNEFIEKPAWLFKYTYRSTKPIKTLPEKETTRVSDRVPIRALSQESAGNRIIYSNYIDKHTSPQFLNYNLTVEKKVDLPLSQDKRNLYNHSLKENRTYQVGLVLSDRYGRQSDVILSSEQGTIDDGTGTLFGASTFYNPFGDSQKFQASDILNFFGDQLLLYLQEPIPDTYSENGYPGLYSEDNPLGWYTYKVVVKQQEQEYYNVYIPNAWRPPNTPTGTEPAYDWNFKTSYFSLVNDNINKVPKDLSNVGPEEKEFRSSVRLFPRVNPTYKDPFGLPNAATYSYVIFPNRVGNEVESIIYNAADDPSATDTRSNIPVDELYKGKSATLAEVNNKQEFGTTPIPAPIDWNETWSILGVYETNPVVSNLDIFYETSTSGYVSELNEAINESNVGPVKLSNDVLSVSEATQPRDPADVANWPGEIIYTIQALNANGIAMNLSTCVIDSVYSDASPGFNAKDFFVLDGPVSGDFNLYTKYKDLPPLWYFYFGTGQTWTFTVTVMATVAGDDYYNTFTFSGNLSNIAPQYNQQDYPIASVPDTIPVEVEPYENYSRLTSTGLSLKPYYYNVAGDNKAAQGLGEFGALPFLYFLNSNPDSSSFPYIINGNPQNPTSTGQVYNNGPNINYFSGSGTAWPVSRERFKYIPYDAYETGGPVHTTSFSPYVQRGNYIDYFDPADPWSCLHWWKLLMFDNGTSSNFANYPFQDLTVTPASFGDTTFTLPTDQMGNPGVIYSRITYDSNTAQPGPWQIFEENQNVSKFIDSNGGTGFLNGCLYGNVWRNDLQYSLTNFYIPKGDIKDPINGQSGQFTDTDGDINDALSECITIDVNGVISINDNLLLSYFSHDGLKTDLVPDSYGNTFGGLIINNELGHGRIGVTAYQDTSDPSNPYAKKYVQTGTYGIFWINFTLNVEDAGGLITSKEIKLLFIA